MKDRIIAFSTLGIIFGLFFYYKVVSPVDTIASVENQNIITNDKNNQLDIIEESISINSEGINSESDCNLSEAETDVLDFSSAFKYYRICNDIGRVSMISIMRQGLANL